MMQFSVPVTKGIVEHPSGLLVEGIWLELGASPLPATFLGFQIRERTEMNT